MLELYFVGAREVLGSYNQVKTYKRAEAHRGQYGRDEVGNCLGAGCSKIAFI